MASISLRLCAPMRLAREAAGDAAVIPRLIGVFLVFGRFYILT